ncbi:MAG: ankyrin repeat domain-containing protein, partial [Phycisphaerae bacterium]
MRKTRREFLELVAATVAGGTTLCCVRGADLPADSAALLEFFAACEAGRVDQARALLRGSPELLHSRDANGRSPFAVALLAGQRPIADMLRAAGYTCDLHEAALALDWDRFNMLASEAGENIVDLANSNHPLGGTAMFAAAAGGAGAEIWRVYAVSADPNPAVGAGGLSPLQKALRFPDLGIAEMTAATLLGNNADPNLAGSGDAPPLQIAAARGSVPLVEMLIRLGGNVVERDRNGMSAVEAARAGGHSDVEKLLAKHALIPRSFRTPRTVIDGSGRPYTPVDLSDISISSRSAFVGKSHGDLEYVTEAVNADPRWVHSVAVTNEICVEACAHTGRKPIVDFLLAHGAPYTLPTAVMRSDYPMIERMLREDPNRIHERGAHDFPLLWYPVIGGCDLRMTEFLLSHGASVEHQHFLGTTAVHWACLRGPVELVSFLVDRGADVNRVGRKFSAK